MVETIRRFDIELANEEDKREEKIDLRVCGFAELAKPLDVKVRKRTLP